MSVVLGGCAAAPADPEPLDTSPPATDRVSRVVVFSGTAAYRHESIGAGRLLIDEILRAEGFEVESTDDPAFLGGDLSDTALVVLLSSSGEVFDSAQQNGLRRFVEAGGALAGVHAATDTAHEWPWFAETLGAEFLAHPAPQEAVLRVVEEHPSTAHLPDEFAVVEEWYNFTGPLDPAFRVLLDVDESTYEPGDGAMGPSHPIAWCRPRSERAGPVWYTALGHDPDRFEESWFRGHLRGGLLSLLGSEQCGAERTP